LALYQVLDEHGFEVSLVDARRYKNAPERKLEMCDSAWLQYLHGASGLLQGASQPAKEIDGFRLIMKYRNGMVQDASEEIRRMQETLAEMNVQLHRVVSDMAGASGLAILDAMVAGERDGRRLAALRDGSVTASEESMVAALESNYLPGYLLLIEQSLERYRFYQRSIGECDGLLREELDKLVG
jgi:transposase